MSQPDKERLKKAFTAGYKSRELDTRKDTDLTESIIERKFNHWYEKTYDTT